MAGDLCVDAAQMPGIKTTTSATVTDGRSLRNFPWLNRKKTLFDRLSYLTTADEIYRFVAMNKKQKEQEEHDKLLKKELEMARKAYAKTHRQVVARRAFTPFDQSDDYE